MHCNPLVRALLTSAALAAAAVLAGCDTDGTTLSGRALQPISPKMLAEMEKKNMSKETPMLVRLFKQESELEVWKQDNTGHFALLKTFPICRWSGDLGPKVKEGDRQAPEGFYTITPAQMNPQSQYYLAFNMGFPNAYDKANDRTGNFLMIHGDCSSRGCYAMTDEQIAEIYALARESFFGGQRSFQIQAYPFRMTPVNMAKHRGNPNMPFWKMLKEGYDHFEVSRLEPKVDVCEKHYVFNAEGAEGKFSPRAQCPIYQVPSEIASAVAEKKKKDDVEIASLIGRTPAAPVKMATDGGMHQVFAEALQGGRAIRGKDGEVERIIPSSAAPGTIPAHVNPPSNVLIANTPAAAPAPAPVQTAQPAPRASNSTTVARAPAQATPRPAQTASAQATPRPAQTAPAQPTQTASVEPSAASRGVDATKNFFNKLFKPKDEPQTQTAATTPASPAPASKPASVVSRPGAQPAATTAVAAKPKPAPTALAEAKPTPLPENDEPTPRAPGAIRPQSSVSAFSGAAPVPAGSFGGGFR